jgi:hypothetical protein
MRLDGLALNRVVATKNKPDFLMNEKFTPSIFLIY